MPPCSKIFEVISLHNMKTNLEFIGKEKNSSSTLLDSLAGSVNQTNNKLTGKKAI